MIKPQWAIRATELFIATDLAAEVQNGSRSAPGTRLTQEISVWLTSCDELQPQLQTADADKVNPSPQMLAALRQAWRDGHAAGTERQRAYFEGRKPSRHNTGRPTNPWGSDNSQDVDLEAGE